MVAAQSFVETITHLFVAWLPALCAGYYVGGLGPDPNRAVLLMLLRSSMGKWLTTLAVWGPTQAACYGGLLVNTLAVWARRYCILLFGAPAPNRLTRSDKLQRVSGAAGPGPR